MKISKFKGGDPLWWLFEVYNFFALQNTPLVSIASYFMEGEALEWFQDLKALRSCTDWVEFVCSLQDRFRTPIHDAPMEATTQEFPLKLTKIQESKEILEVEEQSKIQEVEVTSKIDQPIKAQEIEESTKINEQSNFQDLNACKLYLRSQGFLEKESLKDDIESRPIYEETMWGQLSKRSVCTWGSRFH
uniref:Retrotransposon gag domain-containing protein n=1 Tax=Fagus sylvatica TaxID=28930 RepID=A0A2N9I8U1_FAGSY